MDWITHDEDVWFDFQGDDPHQLEPGRYYRGTVDGYADFGVFVDLAPRVTGLLHRSELQRRLESLDWEPGDTVFVQVKSVRDNGNIDLAWSKRQRPDEFRGARIHDPSGERDDEPIEQESSSVTRTKPTTDSGSARSTSDRARTDDDASDGSDANDDASDGSDADDDASDGSDADDDTSDESVSKTDASDADGESVPDADAITNGSAAGGDGSTQGRSTSSATTSTTAAAEGSAGSEDDSSESGSGSGQVLAAEAERERVPIGQLGDRVGDRVRIEGEVITARQTSGPTIFELRDETGVIDCAAFVEAGVRAYPDIEEGDVVRLDGEVELRRDELQVETEDLTALDDEDRETVERRLAEALSEKARPEAVEPLTDHPAVEAVSEQLLDAAADVRRAILESRPVIVRHTATADGYIAGAAIERAVLPLIRQEHAKADAEYHYFDRRPLEEAVYDMDAATNDVTRMLQDRDRHGEKLPLVLLVGTGSTEASTDGLGLLGVYGAPRVVVDAAPVDESVQEVVETIVNPPLAGADSTELSATALAANLATTVHDDVREDLLHLPAASYWEDAPEAYLDLATEAGYDADDLSALREAVALEAYYQSYEDKRELVSDLLFGGGAAGEGLAAHVSQQFRSKLEDELDTARANLETHETGGVRFAVLDADAYTHRFDFPPTALLLDELHRRERDEGPFATIAIGTDELYVRTTPPVDVRDVAERADETAGNAGISSGGVREGRIEFLSGHREAVEDSVIAALAELLE